MAVNVPAGSMFAKAFAELKARLDRVERRTFSATTTPEHNSLAGLQGGAALERYHLTAAEATSVGDLPEISAYVDAAWTIVQTQTFQAIQDAIDAASSGDTIYLPHGTYVAGAVTQINVNKSVTLRGDGETTLLYQSNTPGTVLNVTASYVTIRDMSLRGPQHTTSASEYGIKVVGAYTDYITNIRCENLRMYSFGHTALWYEFVSAFHVQNCRTFQLQYGGFIGLSVLNGEITSSTFAMSPMSGIVNQYPIALTRASTASVITDPRSENIIVSDNMIEDCEWEGIDTHGGKDLVIANNTIRNCKIGVALVPCPDASGGTDFLAPLNVVVANNLIDSTVTDGSKQVGIKIVGPTNSPVDGGSLEYATGVISGNTIIGYGTESVANSGGIQIYGTKGLAINGNTLINCSPNAIALYHTNLMTNISDNTIVSPWSDTVTLVTGIGLYSIYNSVFIGGNIMDLQDQLAGKTTYFTHGVYASNSSTNKISWGQNRITGYATAETNIGANVASTHGFTDMGLVANSSNPMFGLGRATAATGFPALTNTTTGAVAFRTLQAGTGISITNPAGVAGNPVITATGTASPDLTGSTGIVAQTGSTTYAARTLSGGGGIGITNANGVAGNPSISVNLGGTGIGVQTGTGTFATRSLAAGTGISITNADGISGNPTITNSAPYTAPTWSTATVTWNATTAPSLGDGSLSASYLVIGKVVDVVVYLTMGSTTTYGTGAWYFTFSEFTFTNSYYFGSGLLTDSSASVSLACMPAIRNSNALYIYTPTSTTNVQQALVTNTAPWTWANGDVVRITIRARIT